MKLEYNLENIGNIDKTSITIKPLTIIAGKNSSGKTFVTKSLYTVLNSVYQNHIVNELSTTFYRLNSSYEEIKNELMYPASVDLEFQKKYELLNQKIEILLNELLTYTIYEQYEYIQKNKQVFYTFHELNKIYFEKRRNIRKFLNFENTIDNILLNIEKIIEIINDIDQTIIDSINTSLEVGLKKNYQITQLKSLINRNQEKNLKLDIKELGSIEIDKNSMINFSFEKKGVQEIQNVNNIIFFDSPVYIKIRKALERKNSFLDLFSNNENKYLKGYPEYIEQLYTFVDKEYIDIPDFNLISQEIQEKIFGKLDVSKNGDITYSDTKGNRIPLSLTAMGISNIGLIDLLLRNNVINKGSFLIMDEPEVHLHPEWQVFLAEILYKIAKSGANIILATHSLDFLKAFENILKEENEIAEDIIAINKMPYDETFSELSELEKVGIVLDDLSKPFYDLYMQDI